MNQDEYINLMFQIINKNFNNIRDLDKGIINAHTELEINHNIILNLSLQDIYDIKNLLKH